MSWQRDFDASGPTWESNAAAVAAEKRLEKKMKEEEEKKGQQKKPKSKVPQYVFDNLDEKMNQLQKEENELLQLHNLLDDITEKEKNEINSDILNIRKQFNNLRDQYITLKKSEEK
ncbi:MAG: hypothetical protein LC657_01405 [Desulfobacteraceae bacterium]|nr:hypothetical protein [Desulfobacteraceae bacterium]